MLKVDFIVSELVSSFEKLTRNSGNHYIPSNIDRKPIDTHGNSLLEDPFSKTKVKEAIDDLGLNISPGPNGYTREFFTKVWNIIKWGA